MNEDADDDRNAMGLGFAMSAARDFGFQGNQLLWHLSCTICFASPLQPSKACEAIGQVNQLGAQKAGGEWDQADAKYANAFYENPDYKPRPSKFRLMLQC